MKVSSGGLQQLLFDLIPANPINDDELFAQLFSPEALLAVFDERFRTSSGKGVDRINGFQFQLRAPDEFRVASRKCQDGDYRFAPYLEVLKSKGRGKAPRMIGIPTIRDRVILSQLNQFLAYKFDDRVAKNVAATYVRQISEDLSKRNPATTWICTTDIQTFYDSIQRERLLELLGKRISSKPALALVKHALQAPIVPKNTHRNRHKELRLKKGIPQGLAISNILASIYMQPVDDAMDRFDLKYFRYVDDVLMYGEHDEVHKAFRSLGRRLSLRGLGVHPLNKGKSQIVPISSRFGYLGYVFEGQEITVRDSTIERLLQSIAAKFSDFKHNKIRRLEKLKYLNVERLKEIFLMELNERISGAIKDKKRYGWIAYFNQITDLSLLHELDGVISSFFKRLDEFGNMAPADLKTLHRAYWEMKFNPQGGYVRDYDKIVTVAQKLEFLVQRGRVERVGVPLTDEQINAKYDAYVRRNLAAMLADEGVVYG